MKKYELTNVACYYTCDNEPPVLLHRIRALRDFGHVKAGDLGGWVEKEENLSHDDTCWVKHDAMVFGNATVKQNAIVRDEAKVYGDACVFGDCCISQRAKIYQGTLVWGHALISESAEVCGVSRICGHASVSGHAVVEDGGVFGSAKIFTRAYLKYCLVKNNAIVCGDTHIQGPAYRYSVIIGEDAYVCANDHIYTVSDPNVINNVLTFYRSKSDDILVGISYTEKVTTLKELEDSVELMPESGRIFYGETIEKARKKIAI